MNLTQLFGSHRIRHVLMHILSYMVATSVAEAHLSFMSLKFFFKVLCSNDYFIACTEKAKVRFKTLNNCPAAD